jgi:guanylate kinase
MNVYYFTFRKINLQKLEGTKSILSDIKWYNIQKLRGFKNPKYIFLSPISLFAMQMMICNTCITNEKVH